MVGQYAESWQKLEEALGGRTCLHDASGTGQEFRAQYNGLIEMLGPMMPPPSDAVSTKDGDVDGIKYRIYNPKSATGSLPVGLYTHGGGFVTGDLNGEDALCRALAELVPCVIVSVDYRLAPEHPAPAQLQDSLSVLKWAIQNASDYGGDSSKFFTVGGSAGGGLALAVANRVVADPAKRANIKGVVAIVPLTVHSDNVPSEYKDSYKAYTDNASGVPVIDALSMEQFYGLTKVDPSDKSYFVMLDQENHKNFPPTYICSCEFDPLRDDATIMEQSLKKNGVPVKSDYYEGFPHYFWIFPQIPEGQKFVGNLIAGTQWVISEMK